VSRYDGAKSIACLFAGDGYDSGSLVPHGIDCICLPLDYRLWMGWVVGGTMVRWFLSHYTLYSTKGYGVHGTGTGFKLPVVGGGFFGRSSRGLGMDQRNGLDVFSCFSFLVTILPNLLLGSSPSKTINTITPNI
jgi:hypothetical protein